MAHKKKPLVRYQILIDPHQLGALKKISNETGASVAWMIRQAVTAYLKAKKKGN